MRRWRRAIFHVPAGMRGLPLASAAEGAIKRALARFEKEGWTVIGRPEVRPLNVAMYGPERFRKVESRPAGKTPIDIWVPEHTIYADHPFMVPEKDTYEIAVLVQQRPKPVLWDLPEQYIRKWGLPKGLRLIE